MNKILKSFHLICILFITITFLSGCSNNYIDPDAEGNKNCDNVLEFLSEGDNDGLKNMFCNIIASTDDFDKQIQGAMDFFDGKVISNDLPSISNIENIQGGKQTVLRTSSSVSNIKTSTDKVYEIHFNSCLIFEEDRTREGISELTIKCGDGTTYVIGDYYMVNPEKK